jgi:recombination protein RecT
VVGFYAVAVFKDGSRTFVAMSRKEVERIRDNSRGYQAAKRYGKESVWDSDFTAMGLKTVIRRLCKFLPKSPELATALALDAVSEQGKAQNLDLNQVIDGTYAPVIIDETESLEEAKDGGAAKQSSVVQAVPEPKKDAPAAQAAGPATNAKLVAGIKAMEGAKTIEALDEAYIRAEAELLDGADLEALAREYRRIKANISLI